MSIRSAFGTVQTSALVLTLVVASGCYSDGKWSMPNLAFWKKDAASTPQVPGGVSPPAIGSPVKPSSTAGVASNPAPGAGYNLAGTAASGTTGATSQYSTPPGYSQPTTGSYTGAGGSATTSFGAAAGASSSQPSYPGAAGLPAAYSSPSASTGVGSSSAGNYMPPQTGYYSTTPPSSSYSQTAPSAYGTGASSSSSGSYGGTTAPYAATTGAASGAATYTASVGNSAGLRAGATQPATGYVPAATSEPYANPVRPETTTPGRYDSSGAYTTSPAAYTPAACSSSCINASSTGSSTTLGINNAAPRGSTSGVFSANPYSAPTNPSSPAANPYTTTQPPYGGYPAQSGSGTGYSTGGTGSRTLDAGTSATGRYDAGGTGTPTSGGSYGTPGGDYQYPKSGTDYSPYPPPLDTATSSRSSTGGVSSNVPEYRPGSTRNAVDYPLTPASPFGSTQSVGGGSTSPATSSYR